MFWRRNEAPKYVHPNFDDSKWSVRQVISHPGVLTVEYLPDEADPSDPTIVATATSYQSNKLLDIPEFVNVTMEGIKETSTTGTLNFGVIDEGYEEFKYEWDIKDDFEWGSRHEIVRVFDKGGKRYSLAVARNNGRWSDEDRSKWITLLDRATVREEKPVVSGRWYEDSTQRDVSTTRARELLGQLLSGKVQGNPVSLIADVLQTFYSEYDPVTFAALQYFRASLIANDESLIIGGSSLNSSMQAIAISSARQATRVFRQLQVTENVLKGLFLIGRSITFAGEQEVTEQDLHNTLIIYRSLLDHAKDNRDFEKIPRLMIDLAYVSTRLASKNKEEFYKSAEDGLKIIEGYPNLNNIEEIEIKIVRSIILQKRSKDQPSIKDKLLNQAIELIDECQSRVLDESLWKEGEFDDLDRLRSTALMIITDLQRAVQARQLGLNVSDLTKPIDSKKSKRNFFANDHEQSGVLVLRPLNSTRRLKLPNRFRKEKTSFFRDKPPDYLSLESSIKISLSDHFVTSSVGGPYEALGLARFQVLSEEHWKEIVSGLVKFSEFIFIVPSESEGVQWEVQHIKKQKMLDKLVAIMPPKESYSKVKDMWRQAKKACFSSEVHLPDFRPEGAFVFFNKDGLVHQELPLDSLWNGNLSEKCLSLITK